MRLATLVFMMSSFTMADAMESPSAFVRSEVNGSPVNKLSDFGKSPNSLHNQTINGDAVGSPLQFSFDMQKEDGSKKEQLEEMAERGVSIYKKYGPHSHVSFYFKSILDAKPAMKGESPRSVATAELYLGKMAFKGEVSLSADGNQEKSFDLAHEYLKKSALQTADLRVAAQAAVTLYRVYYTRGTEMRDARLVGNAVTGCQRVINAAHDEESVLLAKLIVSDAAQAGNGMRQDRNLAVTLAMEVAHQNKFPRQAVKGQLLCALLNMDGIERDDWNFEHYGESEKYLTIPCWQTEFKDLQSRAQGEYQKLQAKVQACNYQEGLAYIRRALPVNGYHGAANFWRRMALKNIKTMQELKEQSPHDYTYALNQAENYFEKASYENYSHEIKESALEKLALIYKATKRPNKFEEFEKARIRTRQAYGAKRN